MCDFGQDETHWFVRFLSSKVNARWRDKTWPPTHTRMFHLEQGWRLTHLYLTRLILASRPARLIALFARQLRKQFFKEIIENYLQYGDVYLEVKQSNFPAINLYLNFGFEEIDIRQGYYTDGQDAVIMSRKVNHHGVV